MFIRTVVCVLSLTVALPAFAADMAPKLSTIPAAEVAALMAGQDTSLARLADIYSWPGPRLVLAHAAELGLQPDQIAIAQRVQFELEAEAIDVGRAYLAVEVELEEAFRSGRASAGKVEGLARQSGELRAMQLIAHIKMRPNLTKAQLDAYSLLADATAARTGG